MLFIIFVFTLWLSNIYSTCSYIQRCNVVMSENRPLNPQPSWGLRIKKPVITVLDVVSILGRFNTRQDFYKGVGYTRPEDGNFLTNERFFNAIQNRPFSNWPKDQDGRLVGTDGMTEQQIAEEQLRLKSSASQLGAEAVFTLFAKGATNGMAYPAQVDEEMAKWLSEDGTFDLETFEKTLAQAKFSVALGWVLYIGFQFGGVYVIFFYPLMRYYFPDVDFFPVQTFLKGLQQL